MTAQRKGIEYQPQSFGAFAVTARENRQRDHITINRLVVLIPDRGVNDSALARKIWMLAEPCGINVLFLGLCEREPADDSDARLRMITLATMTQDAHVSVETHLAHGANWVHAVHQLWMPGDAVICMAEQRVALKYRGEHTLSQVIETALDVPVYVIPDIYHAECTLHRDEVEKIAWAKQQLSRLLVPVVVAAAFLFLQVRIGLSTLGLTRTALLCVSGLFEFGVLMVWITISH